MGVHGGGTGHGRRGGLLRPFLFRGRVEQRRLRRGLRRLRRGPFGPCTKPVGAPILHSDAARLGPGGESLFQDPSGKWWMAYRAWDGPASDYSYSIGEFRSLWDGARDVLGRHTRHRRGREPRGLPPVRGPTAGCSPSGRRALRGRWAVLRAPVGGRRRPTPPTGRLLGGGVRRRGVRLRGPFAGSMGGRLLDAPVVGMAPTPDGGGYWLVASDGGVFAFGDATYGGPWADHPAHRAHRRHGADARRWRLLARGCRRRGVRLRRRHLLRVHGRPCASPRRSSAWPPCPKAAGTGWWPLTAGCSPSATRLFGSMGGQRISKPVVAIVAGPGSGGYWLLASDGGLFSFGDAAFLGSIGSHPLAAPVVDGAAT